MKALRRNACACSGSVEYVSYSLYQNDSSGIASWFFASGRASGAYTVRQGTRVGADGLVRVSQEDGRIWIAGATRTVVSGTVSL